MAAIYDLFIFSQVARASAYRLIDVNAHEKPRVHHANYSEKQFDNRLLTNLLV